MVQTNVANLRFYPRSRRRLLDALKSCAKERVHITHASLAYLTGDSERTVQRALKDLERLGFVEVRRRRVGLRVDVVAVDVL